jgi:serine phosphatase RsbU (regulator of sigma subunit)
MLLGFAAEGYFEDQVVKLNPSDTICLLTDGLIESRNPQGQPLGTDQLVSLITAMGNDEQPTDYLRGKLTDFTLGKFEDDISLITIKLL